MIALLQRVTEGSVTVSGRRIAEIGMGLVVLVGVERGDTAATARQLASRVLGYRVFSDKDGRMNLDIQAAGGAILLVPQFTLAADTSSGRRPGFSTAATPEQASQLFDLMADTVELTLGQAQRGAFGADMQLGLVNDGPVTFWLQVPPEKT